MRARTVLKGALSYIPGALKLMPQRGTGGTDSAGYCYGVWLKHLAMLRENGLGRLPSIVAELGPGDSIGTGLAAILSGVDTYYALDVLRFSKPTRNVQILDELVELFKARQPRPVRGWPDVDQYLGAGLFPSHILTNELLEKSLSSKRVAAIRNAILSPEQKNDLISIQYMVPWSDASVIKSGSVDVVISHSVLEHVEDLPTTYEALASWLKPGGLMSHQIDFTAHGLSEKWNGYRIHSELFWKIALGKRAFFINRQPCSAHIEMMLRNGFEIICQIRRHTSDGISRAQLAARWQKLSDDDLNCCELFIQARKPTQARPTMSGPTAVPGGTA